MIFIYICIVIVSFLLMEAVTWCTHKYIMHGLLWNWHKDHHQPKYDATFEKNDRFGLVFSIISMTLFLLSTLLGQPWFLLIGFGILLYGIAYFLVHDIFIHKRLKWFNNTNNWYFRALRKAHKVHHKHLGKEEGECFGMLYVPLKYFREARKANSTINSDHY